MVPRNSLLIETAMPDNLTRQKAESLDRESHEGKWTIETNILRESEEHTKHQEEEEKKKQERSQSYYRGP